MTVLALLQQKLIAKLISHGLIDLSTTLRFSNPAHKLYHQLGSTNQITYEILLPVITQLTQIPNAQPVAKLAKAFLFAVALKERGEENFSIIFLLMVSNYLPLDFFKSTLMLRTQKLHDLRTNTIFMGILACYPENARVFLMASVDKNPASLVQLLRHRLQVFLIPQLAHGINQYRLELFELLNRPNRNVEPRPVVPIDAAQTVRVPDLSATQIFQNGSVVNDEVIDTLLDDFRCPILQTVIVGIACKVKLANGDYQFYDAQKLNEWIQRSPQTAPKNPTTGRPLTQDDIQPAKEEYRNSVLEALKAHLIEWGQTETQALTQVNAWAQDLKWPLLSPQATLQPPIAATSALRLS